MRSACDNAENPFLCRVRAFRFYLGARVFGGIYY
jgi:hypothetical protein